MRFAAGQSIRQFLDLGAGLPSQGNPGVGEKGTVTSAATAVGMEPTAARVLPPQVLFDRPYLMLVTDSTTGEPLFMARVTDPATH